MNNINDPETIFDLDSDELDLLIMYRKLSLGQQKEMLNNLGIESETINEV